MSNEKEYIQELFTKPTETFSEHLELPDNERIIFSGRFGIGKSTFLNHYFEKENAKYNVIHLYPVNYSVLQNEDIFRYTKYDILLRLLIITPKDGSNKYNYSGFFDGLGSNIIENSRSLFSTFLLLIPELGEQLNQFSKELGQFWEDFEKAPKNESEKTNQIINKFILDLHSKEGGIYETGEITQIIQNGLRHIKNEKNENILIIDDLDRIDPAHIFRILNVFSSHFDDRNNNTKNKFGFDKVILVCDIDNIRNIYTAIYGGETDFNGYIDKFYSKEIYRFDNKENINNILSIIFEKIIIGNGLTASMEIDLKTNHFNASYILKAILSECIHQDLVNLRSILKYFRQNIELTNKVLKVSKFDEPTNQTLIVLTVLKNLFGDIRILKIVIDKLVFTKIDDEHNFRSHVSEIIYLLNHEKINKLKKGEQTINLFNIDFQVFIQPNHYKNDIHLKQKEMLSGLEYKILLTELVKIIL
ncbi:MAG: hypothetical protein IPM42_06240 [Saprospiraceae bacterium]|nr:hypothetical protein [Saprospiraceae bacterium]